MQRIDSAHVVQLHVPYALVSAECTGSWHVRCIATCNTAVAGYTSGPSQLATDLQGKAHFTELQAAFAVVVKEQLQSAASGISFNALDKFGAVLTKADTPAANRAHGRVMDVWSVVQRQHARWSASGGASLAAAEAQAALLRGSLEHLESEYFEHMQVC